MNEEITYLTLSESPSKVSVFEILRGRSGDDTWLSSSPTYKVQRHKDTGECGCSHFRSTANCIHTNVALARLEGPTILSGTADKLIEDLKKQFSPVSETILTAGNTKFRKKPITRLDLVAQSCSDGVEYWGYYQNSLVRLILASPRRIDFVLDCLNDQSRFNLDSRHIPPF